MHQPPYLDGRVNSSFNLPFPRIFCGNDSIFGDHHMKYRDVQNTTCTSLISSLNLLDSQAENLTETTVIWKNLCQIFCA